MSTGELACTYAALILHDEGIPVTAEKITTLVKAANVPVESYFPGLFAKLCEKRDINDLILINAVGSGSGAFVPSVAAPAAEAPSAAAPESAAEASKEESDDDMNMFDLFG